MKAYYIIKMFILPFMLGVYILFLLTIAAAHYSGGWIVVFVDKYREGFLEVIMLTSLLPFASYVTFKETFLAIREVRKRRKKKKPDPSRNP